MSEPIISVSGLRGIVGESLTPFVASRYVAAFSAGLPAGPIVVSRDGRPSGSMLAQIVCGTLSACGRRVLYADVASTPTVGVLVRAHMAAGGVQISASHNPPPYNGLKLFGGDGRVLPAKAGQPVLEAYRRSDAAFVRAGDVGALQPIGDTAGQHLRLVLSTVDLGAIRAARFRVLLDCNCGAGSILGQRLLSELGCEVTLVGGQPTGLFEHPPEPTAENLKDVCGKVMSAGAQIGFCQDPDADRLAIIDERGRYIGEEYTLAICVEHVLSRQLGPVVTNCATSRMAEDVARRRGAPFSRSAVGEANVADKMLEVGAVFGGEGNGGPIDPRVGYVRDSFVGMALVLAAMAEQKCKLSDLVEALPRYAIEKQTVRVESEKLPAVFATLERRFDQAMADRQDGLRLDWADRWLIVRGSNTEPIVRLIAEAPTAAEASALVQQAGSLIATI